MRCTADFALSRGALELTVELAVEPGETLALVGPNGAGKSSVLLALAGLLRVDRGRVALGERVLDGGPDGPFVPPERRRVGVVFQEHRLFPHLSARDNVAFGPRSAGASRADARRKADRWLERVGLADRAAARPAELSGGQQQRVALARALCLEPDLLLLDEPLAAVDATARVALRRELREHLAAFAGPRVLVSHAVDDAFALADRIAVLEAGRVVQSGPLSELSARPRTRFVADLVGTNAFRGTADDDGVLLESGVRLAAATAHRGPAIVTVHPRAVSLFRERPSGSPRNVRRATVDGVEPAPAGARVHLTGDLPLVAEVTRASVDELALRPGAEVWIALKATEVGVAPG